ncbi:ketosteroid isomerase [Leptolyngbya sp. 'hensonii']|uniref:nuclear transport factor 2 family protein n=1 Tax=Leptolyngbya sp. 'hensonii' TaxID=1922337 RepID=UPI00094FFF10|nr:nuclear transport factor 2 family protein [Leptolyngbya sp. 'hensonii']OLP19727.1 ketosteroid isomerase [Leptolyngbya sp. 'hensonii']
MTIVNLAPTTVQSVVQQYFAASRSTTKVEGMVACFAEDATTYEPVGGPPSQGHAAIRQTLQGLVDLFAEVGLREEFVSVNGHQVAVKWRGQGLGRSGRTVAFEGIDLFEVNEAGQIQTLWAYWNPMALVAELQEAA